MTRPESSANSNGSLETPLDPLRTGGVIIWRGCAKTFQFKYVSREAEEILGYPTSRWTDEAGFWVDHIHPEDKSWAPSYCARATADCEDHDFEYRMIAKDGRVVWLRDIVRVALKDGVPDELYGVMVDITDRRELVEKIETFTGVFNNTQIGVAVLKLEDSARAESLRLLFANDAASRHLGLDLKPQEGELLIESFPNAFESGIAQQYFEVVKNQEARLLGEIAYEDERVQGVFSIRAFPILHDRVGVAFENVTEAAEAHELLERRVRERTVELQESEEKYRVMVDTMTDAVLTIDENSQILFANRAAHSMFGFSKEELEGRAVTELIPHDLRDLHLEAVRQDVAGRERQFDWEHMEVTGRHKEGREFPISLSIGEGERKGSRVFIGVARDITERQLYEAQLVQAREAALRSARMKSEFLANMSHEIRTPMNGVIGMTGLLLDTNLDSTQREFAETIRVSGENLLTVINDILDFSKIESGKFTLEIADFDLMTTVEEVLELLAPQAVRKGLELAVMIEPNIPLLLRGDAARLWQIFMNLINNALKFTDQGEVVVKGALVWEDEERAELKFEVQDTGIGIDSEQQSKLFKPFSQADSTGTRQYGGTGLGLVISRELVHLMGGEIGVESQPQSGSTFWFTALFDKQKTDAAEAQTPLPESALKGKKALLVDDNETNLRILRLQLEAWGVESVQVTNAMDALKVLEENEFDVAILDLQMEGMDGLELARAIRERERLRALRLVMMTSVAHSDPKAITGLGLDAKLRKPVTNRQLKNVLSRILGSRRVESDQLEKKGAPPESTDLSSEPGLSDLKVLLVEDNPINRRVTSLQLERLGVSADVVCSGAEALEILTKNEFHLILMDCQMPELDGFETTRELRRRWPDRKVGVIALTAHAMEGDRERCIEAGMDDYLGKPLAVEKLKEVLGSWHERLLSV